MKESTTAGESVRKDLSPRESGESRLRIEWDGEKLLLASRSNSLLEYKGLNGAFHYFENSGGFIKILDPEMKTIWQSEGPDYVEVMHHFLGVLMYWGELETFNEEILRRAR